jgi:hypothetical protein
MFLQKIGELPNYRRSVIIMFFVRNADSKSISRHTFYYVVERVTGKIKRGFTEVNLNAYMAC